MKINGREIHADIIKVILSLDAFHRPLKQINEYMAKQELGPVTREDIKEMWQIAEERRKEKIARAKDCCDDITKIAKKALAKGGK